MAEERMRIIREVTETVVPGTTIAVLIHPKGSEQHPIQLTEEERLVLRETLRVLEEKYVQKKKVAVLAADTKTVEAYADLVTGKFMAVFQPCNALLSSAAKPADACDCITDYL